MKRILFLGLLVFSLLLPSQGKADTFEVVYNSAQWLPVVLIDTATAAGKTGVAYGTPTIYYKEGVAGTWTQHTLSATSCTASAGNWCEEDSTNAPGVYRFYVPTTVTDTKGTLYYNVKGTGFKPYFGRETVKVDTAADENDDRILILADTADMQPKLGTPAGASVSADIAAVKTDTAAVLVDTGTTIPATITTAQADLDLLTGTDGATLATSQPNYAPATASALVSMGTNVDAILADTGTDGVVVAAGSKTGYALSAAGVDAILDEGVEGVYSMREVLCILASSMGKLVTSGSTGTFRGLEDTEDRMTFTVATGGNRSTVTFDLTGCQ